MTTQAKHTEPTAYVIDDYSDGSYDVLCEACATATATPKRLKPTHTPPADNCSDCGADLRCLDGSRLRSEEG